MKKHILILSLVLVAFTARSQEVITLSGGYVWAHAVNYSSYYNVDFSSAGTGFRVTGTYEVGPLENKKLLHGFAMGFIQTNSNIKETNFIADLRVRTIPMYYAPKFMIGGKTASAFVRGAIGMQFANFLATGQIDGKDNDWGFYGGVGLGGMVRFGGKFFLNAEYEWAYMSNTFYTNGSINSAQVGFGLDL